MPRKLKKTLKLSSCIELTNKACYLLTMRKLFMIFTIAAFLLGTTISHTHAHLCLDDTHDVTIELNTEAEHNDCSDCIESCHSHHHMVDTSFSADAIALSNNQLKLMALAEVATSDLLYGLKRPPRS